MQRIYLNRFYDGIDCTLGCIINALDYPIYTNELPWKFNRSNESCIPEGVYIMKPYTSSHHGDCFKLIDVEGRSVIRVHSGNKSSDSLGCILVGYSVGNLKGKPAVLKSKVCLKKLRKKITGPVELHIKNRF